MVVLLLAVFTLAFNEDNDHFFKLDAKQMTRDGLVAYADRVMQGPMTHFVMCVNGQRTSYDSKTWEPIWTNLDTDEALLPTGPNGTRDRWAVNAKALFDQGIDPYAVWCECCRRKGVSPWISMRMNDIHWMSKTNFFRNTTFCKTHPEYWRDRNADRDDWNAFQLDYTHPEVRDYAFAQFQEVASRWDCDGVEMDWMRSGYHFPRGKARENAHVLTDFMRRARAEINRVSEARGRKIGLAVRVPRSVEACRETGYDVETWLREDLVDVIVGSSYLNADFDIPVAEWLALVRRLNPRVKFLPCADSVAHPAKSGREREMTAANYRAIADRFIRGGAEGVYLFNLQYLNGNGAFDTVCREGLSPEAIAGKEQVAVATVPDFPSEKPMPASTNIVLEGSYPDVAVGHLQDVCWNGADAFWWTHTRAILKTDLDGKILRRAEVEGHNAGCVLFGDALYVAVCAMEGPRIVPFSADSRVQINEYDAETLTLHRKRVLPINDRAGSLCRLSDGTFLVGCLRPDDITATQVRFHHVDASFNLISTHVLDDLPVPMGIETIKLDRKNVYLFIYDGPVVRLDADTLRETGRVKSFGGMNGAFFVNGYGWLGVSEYDEKDGARVYRSRIVRRNGALRDLRRR